MNLSIRKFFKFSLAVFISLMVGLSSVLSDDKTQNEQLQVLSNNGNNQLQILSKDDNEKHQVLPQISVVMPVYNGEKYLRESIESVLNSTFKNLELICVNDGSKDNSLEILKEYSEKDPRLVFISQENHGESVTRQNGLNLARGEYVAFIDQDDKIDPKAYETAYNYIHDTEADIICFGWKNFSDDGSKIIRNDCKFDELKIYSDWWEAKKQRPSIYLWNKLYKKSLIVDNNVKFNPNLRICDDEGFNLCVYSQAKKIVNIPYTFYNYRQNGESTMFKMSFTKFVSSYSEMWRYVKEYYREHNIKIGFFKILGYFFSICKGEIWPFIKTLLGFGR